ncbi:hypothetical protein CQ052_12125 [Ochrobactrum sp. MYb15]|nr:hypothetical protein CWE02_00505 [Brucella pituitosa]PQZ50040.1 hypothetical protein CQZ90_05250 [Ochrobactrum sp. MYb19]PRA55008.1 hypothetical protein CQ062_08790 [Ochrobactrum sp. MYb68]PRA68082.1 hypothetical protein CQ053_00240 [Ochrobactrum sp. MYb18]PRA74690.1 hypothetical protein CQ049_15835 [Brucella thiophenivorans]PRA82780.1 hypothetical protein CQ054_19355 [Ochrobactrum sp. MYb29]PRA90332.1 hypothetical protein CQ051_10145 [Ochrobactrum sp. MYb14]PRA95783.1 hypothetical protei
MHDGFPSVRFCVAMISITCTIASNKNGNELLHNRYFDFGADIQLNQTIRSILPAVAVGGELDIAYDLRGAIS